MGSGKGKSKRVHTSAQTQTSRKARLFPPFKKDEELAGGATLYAEETSGERVAEGSFLQQIVLFPIEDAGRMFGDHLVVDYLDKFPSGKKNTTLVLHPPENYDRYDTLEFEKLAFDTALAAVVRAYEEKEQHHLARITPTNEDNTYSFVLGYEGGDRTREPVLLLMGRSWASGQETKKYEENGYTWGGVYGEDSGYVIMALEYEDAKNALQLSQTMDENEQEFAAVVARRQKVLDEPLRVREGLEKTTF